MRPRAVSRAALASKPAPVDGCDGTVGYFARVTADAVSVDCTAPADQPKPATGDIPVLDYGAKKTAEGFTCTSERTGMTCTNDESGKGFTLARAGAQPF